MLNNEILEIFKFEPQHLYMFHKFLKKLVTIINEDFTHVTLN